MPWVQRGPGTSNKPTGLRKRHQVDIFKTGGHIKALSELQFPHL